jgi:hypothetical protein
VTIGQFAEALAQIGQNYRGSVTSWGRTDQHAKQVGGFAGDPHTWWLGADMIYDTGFPPIVELTLIAKTLGLKVIREQGSPHDHYQPLDMPAGPVTAYGGTTRTLA